ncbi:MAG: VWA domain-containing protein [Chloroflexi bacterium]|nr:VWA domain-containing protein [Chloroflexota bacterium]
MRRSIERFVTGAALSLLAALPAVGQDSPLPELFSDVIDVRVVNVEAVVTDRKGNRIRGLQAGDFELLVDGVQAPIAYFTEIDEGIVQAAPGGGVEIAEAMPALNAGEPVGTNFLVFIDNFFSIRQHRDDVLRRLEGDLAQLGPADRVAAVASDGANVALLTGWTNSASEIREALRQARELPALGLMRRVDQRAIAQSSNEQEVQQAKRYQAEQVKRSALAAVATLRSFAGREGRKVMLVLAGGWGLPQPTLEDRQPTMLDINVDNVLGPLVDTANLVGYTLYPVDVPGFRAMSSNDASVGYSEESDADRGTPEGPGPGEEWLDHDSLRYLADETGGLAMINAQRKTALAQAAADTRAYYWLGFEPPRNENDEDHKVEVRVDGRPELRVRSRRSYLDMSRSTEVTMLVEGALLFGGSPGAELLAVRLGSPERARSRKVLVPMEIAIPLDHVQLLPIAGRWTNELEFRVTVIDEDGDRSETPVEKILISGASKPNPGDVFYYETNLMLRRREHRFVAAVYDPLTGAILSANGTVGP